MTCPAPEWETLSLNPGFLTTKYCALNHTAIPLSQREQRNAVSFSPGPGRIQGACFLRWPAPAAGSVPHAESQQMARQSVRERQARSWSAYCALHPVWALPSTQRAWLCPSLAVSHKGSHPSGVSGPPRIKWGALQTMSNDSSLGKTVSQLGLPRAILCSLRQLRSRKANGIVQGSLLPFVR